MQEALQAGSDRGLTRPAAIWVIPLLMACAHDTNHQLCVDCFVSMQSLRFCRKSLHHNSVQLQLDILPSATEQRYNIVAMKRTARLSSGLHHAGSSESLEAYRPAACHDCRLLHGTSMTQCTLMSCLARGHRQGQGQPEQPFLPGPAQACRTPYLGQAAVEWCGAVAASCLPN